MGRISRQNHPKKLTTKDILRLLQILFHIPSNRSMGLVEQVFGICRTCSRLELYDVNFGGIEQMTKRLTIALVALAMFVLVAVIPVAATTVGTWYEVAPGINQGATVFVGEQGLDIWEAWNSSNQQGTPTNIMTIGWWASAAQLRTTSPTQTVNLDTNRLHDFTVTQAEFELYPGEWYLVDANDHQYAKNGTGAIFNVKLPSLDVTLRDPGQSGADITNKAVPLGTQIQFRIGTNMYTTLTDETLANPSGTPALRYPVWNITGNASAGSGDSDGYIDLVVKTESGTILSALYTDPEGTTTHNLKALAVWTQPFSWGQEIRGNGAVNWATDAAPGGVRAYKAGSYVVYAVSKLNNMGANYLSGGAAYTGRTVSQTVTITIVSDTVKITVNKDSIVRTKDFSVTITGKPSTIYNVWIKNTANMQLGAVNNEPPLVTKFQDRVVAGDNVVRAPFVWSTEGYLYQNGGPGKTVGTAAYNGRNHGNEEYSYASVKTNTAGTWTVGFSTSANTKAQKYTVQVEQNFGDCEGFDGDYTCNTNDFKSDSVDVKVEKGAVTIVAAGDQSYYLGEEVKFSGTNTESDTTYLFIIGPNLPPNGAKLSSPREAVDNGDPTTFERADVQADNTWSYKWGTSSLPLDAGTYTVYGASQAVDNQHLNEVAYGTVSIIIKKPFVSATASQSTVAKADKLIITGTAEGSPSAGVAIWILGKNKALYATTNVETDSTFSYEVTSEMTRNLYAGQYFVVVQHPMQNDNFDIQPYSVDSIGTGQPVGVYNYVLNDNPDGTLLFWLEGPGSLQGSDAAEALVQAINDPNVDDTYTKLQFLVEQPVINIVPIGDKHVGDKFDIKALTNLAVDDEILVEVYSSSFKPTQKSQSGEFSGATGTVKVTKGDSGMNTIVFPVDAATFKPDEYIVSESAVIQEITGTALFNVLEGAAPTAVPTAVVTTAAPTTVATPIPTTVKPTPTPTKSPGYGALIALIGLGAVAFIVVRRH
jgi:PGF-CTERM protein